MVQKDIVLVKAINRQNKVIYRWCRYNTVHHMYHALLQIVKNILALGGGVHAELLD